LNELRRLRPSDCQVWIDFDGTISQRDVLDELIRKFAKNDSWRLIEERWAAGLIGSFDCLREEFALLRVSAPELTDFVRRIPIDPGFNDLIKIFQSLGVPVAILSDGVERFIRLILAENGFSDIPIYANRIAHKGDRLSLRCHLRSSLCESGAAHCKCSTAARIGQAAKKSIYIGDGRSDLCPAYKADVVFAKGVLAKELARRQKSHISYNTLRDVIARLQMVWLPETFAATATGVNALPLSVAR
jgi:2,3-diketo-5-methylthio-1-phosphopentane phosphatase